MGFFSWDCVECGHPMLSSCATNKINKWMAEVVVQRENGTTIIGQYDGYGRVCGGADKFDIASYSFNEPCCRHYDCWVAAGRPGFTTPSNSSRDQGYFFDKEHDIASPLKRKK